LLPQVKPQQQTETLKIDLLLNLIEKYEGKLTHEKKAKTAQSLLSLYNKAIEYYAHAGLHATSQDYLAKIKSVFEDPEL